PRTTPSFPTRRSTDLHVLRAKASVLMDLQLRTAEVAQRAQMLREQEKRLHQRELSEQRQRWEEESLRRQMEDQCRVAEQMAEKADRKSTRLNSSHVKI